MYVNSVVGLRNTEGPKDVWIMDTEIHYGLRTEVYVFRLYFGFWATDLKCYNFICCIILVSMNHDFKLHVHDFGLNKRHAVGYL